MQHAVFQQSGPPNLKHHNFGYELRCFSAVALAAVALLAGCSNDVSPPPQSLDALKENLGISELQVTQVVQHTKFSAKRPELQSAVDSCSALGADVSAFKHALANYISIDSTPGTIAEDFLHRLQSFTTALGTALGRADLSAIEHSALSSAREQAVVVSDLIASKRLTSYSGTSGYNSAVDGNAEQLSLLGAKLDTALLTLSQAQNGAR